LNVANSLAMLFRGQFYAATPYEPCVRKPIRSPLYFEARFRIRGKVLQSCMCPHCEQEGELYLRVARSPGESWAYDPKDPQTFVDIIAFDPKGSYFHVKPSDWVDADIVCFGYMKRVRAARVEIEGNILSSGSRKIGRASLEEGRLTVDFAVFKASLTATSEEEMTKVLKSQRIRDGSFLETDCSVDVEVKAISRQSIGQARRGSRRRN